ncbi:hypothetical protein BDY21DRAFT_365595 [Lineolata rhizophorae]|uniref:Uncharacterized protein n=1 Tax=Lineolata rhizophorae TaxID=578093 RepID=A0A6A6NUI6_9PEZI|nr:hypothetical protein BDY21DRAFT_365595 [Lineolata rhizophorae]
MAYRKEVSVLALAEDRRSNRREGKRLTAQGARVAHATETGLFAAPWARNGGDLGRKERDACRGQERKSRGPRWKREAAGGANERASAPRCRERQALAGRAAATRGTRSRRAPKSEGGFRGVVVPDPAATGAWKPVGPRESGAKRAERGRAARAAGPNSWG